MNSPNIIYIFADDMGYGDMRCNNPDSRIPTPNLDRLAQRGMRFTDSHASSAVCTPSRYSVLTGRYNWRSRLKHGIVWQWDASLIEEGRETVASLLKKQGYHTACLGKWHLGWDWPTLDGSHPNDTLPFGVIGCYPDRTDFGENIDYAGRIGGGPVDRGFDTYFGVDVPNFPPYTWFENDRLTDIPTVEKPESMYGNAGKMVPNWDLEKMIPEFTRRAVDLVEARAKAGEPFFLYFPLTSPHSPIVPNKEFQGKSGAGNYGDFVCEVDWVVGQVYDALERTGQLDNTLLIFTSDNGPEGRTPDDLGAFERIRESDHYSMGELRGIKRDAWEGGHRTPFVACWPDVIPAGTVCEQPVCLVDLMATCAEITGAELADDAGEDSVSMLPLLRGEVDRPTRRTVIHHSLSGKFAVRKGKWVFIDAPSADESEEPDWFREQRGSESVGDQAGLLYDLSSDLAERHNLYAEHPEVVKELSAILERIKQEAGGAGIEAADGTPIEELTE